MKKSILIFCVALQLGICNAQKIDKKKIYELKDLEQKHETGNGVTTNYQKVVFYLEEISKNDDISKESSHWFDIASYYEIGGPELNVDYEKAIYWYEKAYNKNDSNKVLSLCNIVYLYDNKLTGQKDSEKAKKYFEEFLKLGSERNIYEYGDYYTHDRSRYDGYVCPICKQDYTKARYFLTKFSEMGNKKAKIKLEKL